MRLLATLAFEGFGAAILPAAPRPAPAPPTGRSWSSTAWPLGRSGSRCAGGALLSTPARAVRDVIFDVVHDHGARHPGITSRVAA